MEKLGEFRGHPNVETRTILSQAIEGKGSMEGAETRRVSPNNNPAHERPAPLEGGKIVRSHVKA